MSRRLVDKNWASRYKRAEPSSIFVPTDRRLSVGVNKLTVAGHLMTFYLYQDLDDKIDFFPPEVRQSQWPVVKFFRGGGISGNGFGVPYPLGKSNPPWIE